MASRGQKERDFYRLLISRLLIICGSCLMGIVLLVNVIDYVRSRTAVSSFKTEKEQIIVVNTEEATEQTEEQAVVGTSDMESEEEKLSGDVLGVLRIPKIDLEEAVKEGSSSSVISSALGHMEGTAMPGAVGNCAIAGHRNYVFGRFFNRLNEIEKGDTVEIETLEGVYVYTVTDSFIVEPEEVSVLSQDTETQDLTLITCTPLFVGSHRLIIQGTLTEMQD